MTYFVGAYWPQRKESRIACASRISNFAQEIAKLDSSLVYWFKRRTSKKTAPRALPMDPNALESLLKTNRRDIGNDVIEELGFSFSAWTGKHSEMTASVSVMCGAYSPLVNNSVVLSFDAGKIPTPYLLREILKSMVSAFEPHDAVVNSMERLLAHPSLPVLKIPSFYSYRAQSGFEEHKSQSEIEWKDGT